MNDDGKNITIDQQILMLIEKLNEVVEELREIKSYVAVSAFVDSKINDNVAM